MDPGYTVLVVLQASRHTAMMAFPFVAECQAVMHDLKSMHKEQVSIDRTFPDLEVICSPTCIRAPNLSQALQVGHRV